MTYDDDLLRKLILSIFHLDDLLKVCANEITRPAGQTGARWQVLNALNSKDQTVSEIARSKNVARQGVQRIVNDLCTEGLAAKLKNPMHSRYFLISMTQKGSDVLISIEKERKRWSLDLIKGLGEEINPEIIEFLQRFAIAIESTIPEKNV